MSCCAGLWLVAVVLVIYKLIDRYIRTLRVDKYEDRYILVTGCDSGFGNLLCKRLDALGCHVFAGCYTESGMQEITKSCSVRLHALPLDVTKSESIREAFNIIKSKLPDGKGLWGLMNNAGLMGAVAPPEWLTMSDYRFVADVNLFGLVDTTMTFLPLIKRARGRVVSTSSVAGRLSVGSYMPYNISKYGVEAFMDGLRRRLHEYGVKCSLIEPGIHSTTFWQTSTGTQKVRAVILKQWEDLTPEVQQEFGKEYHDRFSDRTLKAHDKFSSTRLEDVVDAYEHALLALYPRPRYIVGRDARWLWIPLTWAPEWFSDGFLRIISKGSAKPALLKSQ